MNPNGMIPVFFMKKEAFTIMSFLRKDEKDA